MITRFHESNGTGTVAGRLSRVRLQSPGVPAYRLDYGYDAFGRHSTFTSHHGDTQRTATYGWIPGSHLLAGIDHGGLLHTTYRYEPHRDVKTTVSNWVAGVGGQPNRNLSTYAHDYSPDRRRVNVVNTGEAFAEAAFNLFDYNERNEVVRSLRHPGSDTTQTNNEVAAEARRYPGSDTTQTNNEVAAEARRYEYDPIGNRLLSESGHSNLTTYLSNQLNRYTNTTESGVSNKIHHDPDGNLTNDARFAYEWNGENRLVAATPLSPTNGAKQVRNDYDHQGRRWRKRVHTWDGSTWTLTETRTFVYDAWNPIQETVETTTTTEHLHYDWGIDLSLTLQGAGGVGGLLRLHHYTGSSTNTHRLLYDANGNVGQLVDAGGGLSAKYEYDAFGKTVRATGATANVCRFRFSAKYHDDETGLVYYGFRYFYPPTGSWTSRDPIEELGGYNMYTLAGNDMIGKVDLLGREECGNTGIEIHPDGVVNNLHFCVGSPLRMIPPCDPNLVVRLQNYILRETRAANGVYDADSAANHDTYEQVRRAAVSEYNDLMDIARNARTAAMDEANEIARSALANLEERYNNGSINANVYAAGVQGVEEAAAAAKGAAGTAYINATRAAQAGIQGSIAAADLAEAANQLNLRRIRNRRIEAAREAARRMCPEAF